MTASSFPGFEALADDPSEALAALVRRRQRLGLSQTTVAARMSTSQSAVPASRLTAATRACQPGGVAVLT
jgi:hypothetical protein